VVAFRNADDLRKARSLVLVAEMSGTGGAIDVAEEYTKLRTKLVMSNNAVVYGRREAPQIEEKQEDKHLACFRVEPDPAPCWWGWFFKDKDDESNEKTP
jgi:hypothetical protein